MADSLKKTNTPFIAILTAVIIFACFILTFVLGAFALPPQFDGTFVGALKYKVDRLEKTEGKKIVTVGGSAVAFGLKSEYIEEYFPDYTAVNLGTYADMGTSVMLDIAKANVREGDIYVICPEQDGQTLSTYYNAESFWQAADGRFSMLKYLSSDKAEPTAAAFLSFSGKKIKAFLNGGISVDGIYSSSSFNSYGDIEHAERDYNVMSLGYNPEQPVSFSKDVITDEFIEELNEFNLYAWKRGATVYYHFPPVNASAVTDSTPHTVNSYFDYLQDKLDFAVIGDPNKAILNEGWFYDTNFHLNDSGAYLFTKAFIEDLRLALKINGNVDIPVPEMPEKPEAEFIGDCSDAKYFTYEESEKGLILTGLTEEGYNRQTLVVPSHIDEKKVFDYSKNLFKNNSILRETTFQQNIGTLYDGTFEGCGSLERIILTAKTPNSYSVGDGLLDGTTAYIAVPYESLAAYINDYTWQKYSLRIEAYK